MKGLILSITTGQGHNQTAMVLSEAFNQNGIDCRFIDVYKYINPALSTSVNQLYLMSTKTLPKVYGRMYRMLEKRETPSDIGLKGMDKLTNSILSKKLIKFLSDEKPDFVICTHVFSALLMTYVNSISHFDLTTIGVVTDFTVHPYWEDTFLDYYIIANERLLLQGTKKGFPINKFLPIGIPIDAKFAKKADKQEMRKELNIDDKPTILIMSGSMGFGHVIRDIKELDKLETDFQMVSVCGNNKSLKSKIDSLKLKKKIYNHGFIKNVDQYMDAADIIITKPGGLTTSEALAKQIPMVINNPIPGQEDRNSEFLLNNGAAMKISHTYPIDEVIYQFFSDLRVGDRIKTAMEQIAKPNATRDLVDFVMNNVKEKI